MNKELALRTLAYLKTHYNNNDETIICKEDIDAIDFVLDDNEKLSDLINEYENKGYDIAQERTDFMLEIQRLNNIINELEKILVYEKNDYNGNLDIETRNIDSEFLRGNAWEAEYILDKLKELKENK